MSVLITVLQVYLAGAVLVALRLGWHLAFRLDRFDWQYDKVEKWAGFGFGVLAWPLFLLRAPRNLIDPSEFIDVSDRRAARDRSLDRFLRSPPPCGDVLRFRPSKSLSDGIGHGEFLFSAAVIEKRLRDLLREGQQRIAPEWAAMINWLSRRSAKVDAPTDIPEFWTGFESFAVELCRAGEGKARCEVCNGDFLAVDSLNRADIPEGSSVSYAVRCNSGHYLLRSEGIHFIRTSAR
jgi:hypothetical protein